MGDASKNNLNDVASFFKRNDKRPRTQLEVEDTTGDAYLSASENSENSATPTASLTDMSDGERNGPTIPLLSVNGNSHVSIDTVVTSTQLSREKQTLAFKLDKLHDKVGRYESHVAFLTKCIDNNVTPNGLRVYVEPSIGNRDDEFLQSWHDDLDEFSKKLTRKVIEYSEKTVEKTKLEISETSEKLKALISEPAFTEIKKALTKNDNTRNNELTSRKNRKFYKLKYGERDREPERSGAQNRPQNGTVILSNRGHRGMNRPSNSDMETRNDNFRDNRNLRNDDRRGHIDSNRRETRNRQAGPSHEDDNERLLSVINNRNRNYAEATRNQLQVSDTNNHNQNRGDEHLHELISRRNSRSNLRQERNRATGDHPREILSRNERDTRPREDRNRNEDRDVQIRALHQKIDVLERETHSREDRNRNNDNRDVLIQSLNRKIEVLEQRRTEPEQGPSNAQAGSQQKNDQGAQQHQGPRARTLEEMQAYLADAMATISEFAKQLSGPTASTQTHSDK